MRTYRMTTWMTSGALVAGLLAGGADPMSTDAVAVRAARGEGGRAAGRQATASVEWNEVARTLVARNNANTFVAFRVYTLVSVAQRDALRAVESAHDNRDH